VPYLAAQDLPAAFAVGTIDDEKIRHLLHLPALKDDHKKQSLNLENQRQCRVESEQRSRLGCMLLAAQGFALTSVGLTIKPLSQPTQLRMIDLRN
jgi:hypothetical protein